MSRDWTDRFWAKVRKGPECWQWTGWCHKSSKTHRRLPYGKFKIRGKTCLAHKLSYELAFGPIPSGKVVRHTCDNPKCVRPDHLKLGTLSDNMQDMMRRGRGNGQIPGGTDHPSARLTEDEVRTIRESSDSSTQAELAKEFGVSSSTISGIIRGRIWKHV